MPWQPWVVQFMWFLSTVLGICSSKVVLKESCLAINGFFFSTVHGSFVSLVCLLPPQCKHMQLPAGQLCLCVCCCPCCGDAEYPSTFQFSMYSFRAVRFFLCSNSDLWIKTCFFLLPLLTAIFQVTTEVPPPQELRTMGAQVWKLWVSDLLPGWNETNRLDSVCLQCSYQGCEAGNVKKNAGSPTFTLKAMHCL